jgi:hypothetical protein
MTKAFNGFFLTSGDNIAVDENSTELLSAKGPVVFNPSDNK